MIYLIYQSISLSIYQSINQSINLSIYLSIYISICPSIYPSIHRRIDLRCGVWSVECGAECDMFNAIVESVECRVGRVKSTMASCNITRYCTAPAQTEATSHLVQPCQFGKWQLQTRKCSKYYAGGWFGTFFISPHIGDNHFNWLTFLEWDETTDQYVCQEKNRSVAIALMET